MQPEPSTTAERQTKSSATTPQACRADGDRFIGHPAILQNEPERHAFNVAIAAADQRSLSAASLVELSIVIGARYGADAQTDLDAFLNTAQIEIISVDRGQAELARCAFAQFGKGRHRAALNFGDCFSYALAKWLDQPLLFKGDDFCHTDLLLAAPSAAAGPDVRQL